MGGIQEIGSDSTGRATRVPEKIFKTALTVRHRALLFAHLRRAISIRSNEVARRDNNRRMEMTISIGAHTHVLRFAGLTQSCDLNICAEAGMVN